MNNLNLKTTAILTLFILVCLPAISQNCDPCIPGRPLTEEQKTKLMNTIKADPIWTELKTVNTKLQKEMQFGLRFLKIDKQRLAIPRPAASKDYFTMLGDLGVPNAKEIIALEQQSQVLFGTLRNKYPELAKLSIHDYMRLHNLN
ncbi:MAG TPA: hypothetical protein VD993_08935 [Chitinophagaceae bacterium]|nr:hypothetical protein [Chitinophagaceae bacterium]